MSGEGMDEVNDLLANIPSQFFEDWPNDNPDARERTAQCSNVHSAQTLVETTMQQDIPDELFDEWSDENSEQPLDQPIANQAQTHDQQESLSNNLMTNSARMGGNNHPTHKNDYASPEWLTCNDDELVNKVILLHFIGSFGFEGARLCTLKGNIIPVLKSFKIYI